MSGGAGLFSTLGDYARFLQMLLNGGALEGARLLSPKTIELMTADATSDLEDPLDAPGYGSASASRWCVTSALPLPLGSEGMYSWGGILGTSLWVDPKERMVGVMMIERYPHPDRLDELFQTLANQAVVK